MKINENTISEMLAALTANIEYLSQNGSAQIRIRNGQLVNTVADKYVYQFELEFLQSIEPDADVEIRISGTTATGKVAALSEGSIQIEVDKNLGDKVSEAILIISSYYLLEMLKKRLEAIQSGEIELSDLASKVFDATDFDVSVQEDYIPPPSKDSPVNKYQLAAIQLALGSPVSFIWGPPGTGKTAAIASIIEGFMAQGKSVLLLSHTNKATDEALSKTIKHLGADNQDYQDGKIIRFGDITLDELKDKYVTPAAIAEKNGKGLKNRIKEIESDIKKLTIEIASSKDAMKSYEVIQEVDNGIQNIKKYVSTKKADIQKHQNEIDEAISMKSLLKKQLAEYEAKGTLARIFSTTKPAYINEQSAKLITLIDKRKEQIDVINGNLSESKKKYKKLIDDKEKLAVPIESFEYYEELIKNGAPDIVKMFNEQNELQKQIDQLSDQLIFDAKVVATTLTKSYISKVVLGRSYDCVIIDEASMAPLPAVLCASGLAQQNVVIVGDFIQLPPVTKHKIIRGRSKSEEDAKEEERLIHDWLLSDIFAVAGIEQGVKDKKNPQKLRQLKRQYRMHQSIADIINEIAYGQFGDSYTLETDTQTTNDRFPDLFDKEPAKNAHVAFYNTSERAPVASQTDSGSYYNLYNALVCIEIAKQAVESGYKSVGIISAYRAQVNLIQKMLVDTFEGDKIVDADTVHRFQGGEKQLIILDVTTPNTKSMYDDGEENGNDMKLLNVAISRSQDKCVIVGDITAIMKYHSPSSLVRRIIEHVNSHHYPIYNTEEMLDGFRLSEQTDEWLRKLASSKDLDAEMEKSELFSEKEFYGQFINDMLSAKSEVIIDSPYMTTKRIDDLYQYFEQLQHKGVEIYVLTRVAKEQDGKMQYYTEVEIERLSKLGIKVLPFVGKIHRKIAIIDRRILWEGSLNILSQNDSREIMRRFVGESSSKQMMSFLKLDKNLGELGKPTLRHCEFCNSPIAWYWTDTGFYGVWTYCLLNRHKEGIPPKTTEQLKQVKTKLKEVRKSVKEITADGAPICPTHQLVMIKRSGRFGEFWGCPKYPACRVTHKIS